MTAPVIAIPGYIAGSWTIDPVHSEVGFSVRHMMVSKVRGRFKEVSGSIVTGQSALDSTVTAEIVLDSIDTGNEMRDGHLRSPDFFDTTVNPTMTYRSTGIRTDGDGFIVDGELTLKGVTKSVPLHLEIEGFGPDAFGGTRAGFSAKGEISRSDFAVSFDGKLENGGAVVGDKITLTLDVECVLEV